MKNHVKTALLAFFGFTTLAMVAQEPEFGLASFYSDDFQGGRTAYGEIYDKKQLTTAHKFYPYGSMLRVTRLDNKKSVTVKVIDKGPFVKGRVVDLSRAAAEKIGLLQDGVADVKVELISRPNKEDALPIDDVAIEEPTRPTDFSNDESLRTDNATASTDDATPAGESKKKEPEETIKPKEEEKKPVVAKEKTATARLVGKDYTQYGLYKIVLQRPSQKGYGVQVISLTNYPNVLKQVADLQAKGFDNILVSIEKGSDSNPIYKIILGPLDSEKEAKSYMASLKKKHKLNGFLVNLDEIAY